MRHRRRSAPRAHVHKAAARAARRRARRVTRRCATPVRWRRCDRDAALAAAATLVAHGVRGCRRSSAGWPAAGRHELAWTISLAMFAARLGRPVAGRRRRAGRARRFRVFYLFGAILNVPWLALGTVYLLGRAAPGGRRRARRLVVAVAGFAAGVMVRRPAARRRSPADELPQGADVFGAAAPRPRRGRLGRGRARRSSAARCGRRGGCCAAGARGRRRGRRSPPARLALGNVLIAVGTLVLSASGTLAGRLGKDTAFARHARDRHRRPVRRLPGGRRRPRRRLPRRHRAAASRPSALASARRQRRARRRTLPPRFRGQLVDEHHLRRALVAGQVVAGSSSIDAPPRRGRRPARSTT